MLSLFVGLACTQTEPSDPAQVQTLEAAVDELRAARTAFEADRAATPEALEKLRGEIAATNAKLAEISTTLEERPRPRTSELPSVLGSRSRSPEDAADAAAAIRCESDTRCTIDRSFLDTLLANPEALARQARIVPSMRDGVTRGFKLYGLRRGSVLEALGLHNGDLVASVNGHDLDSHTEALEVYTKLRTASKLELALERRGAPLTLTVEIVPGETSGSSAP